MPLPKMTVCLGPGLTVFSVLLFSHQVALAQGGGGTEHDFEQAAQVARELCSKNTALASTNLCSALSAADDRFRKAMDLATSDQVQYRVFEILKATFSRDTGDIPAKLTDLAMKLESGDLGGLQGV